jgi:hypothetical protein
VSEPGLFTDNNAPAGTRARPAQQSDPLGELRDDLAMVLRVLETRAPVALVLLGRRKANKFSHALEAARREVRRALEATGASAGSGSA